MKIEKIISYLLHPVLFSTIGTLLYFMLQPEYLPKEFKYKIVFVVFISTYIIPILFLFILKKSKSIEDFHLKTIKERILPLFFFSIITFLLAFRLKEIGMVKLLSNFFYGASFAMVFVVLLFITKLKTSLHTLAIGGLVGFIVVISLHYKIDVLYLISALFLIFGLIAFARLKMKAHNSKEIYFGFFLGVIFQFLVYWINF